MKLRSANLLAYGALAWLCGACGDGDDTPRDAGASDGGGVLDAAGERDGAADAGEHEADAGAGEDGALGDAGADAGDAAGEDAGAEVPRWYEARAPLVITLSGAFGDAFRAAFAGTPDGIVPPLRKKDPFPASAAYGASPGAAQFEDVTLALRGNSSLQECSFPKLKLSFVTRIDDVQHVFFDTKKVKIGTHCGEEDSVNGTIGRLRNEQAAWREETVYALARALGITIMQTRPAELTYTDASADAAFPPALTRKGFLLEHVDELARRLGATALVDPVDCGADTTTLPNKTDVLRVKFFHAMIGNWDWTLGPVESNGCGPLMNTEVLVFPDGAITLVPADFDLSAFVVGEVRNTDNNQLEPITADNALASARHYLQTFLAGEPSAAVTDMKAEYRAQRTALRAMVDASPVDAAGKVAGRLLLDGFFQALDE